MIFRVVGIVIGPGDEKTSPEWNNGLTSRHTGRSFVANWGNLW
jgi:hypothetical protein